MQKEMTTKNKGLITRRCGECGNEQMVGMRENYNYTESGLRSVILKHILVFHCAKCGAIAARIPAMAMLHRAIALSLITKDSLLSGEEIRFLRKMTGLTGVELSSALGVHKATLSKWETDKRNITKNSDASLRLLCFAGILQNLLGQKDLVPQMKEDLKKFSAIDIKHFLRAIRKELTGPKKIRIDPEELTLFGAEEPVPELTETVQ
jgi:putative zinc finger/helix-turn-helix YgiT family protein